jgi:copper chaperone CopZ
MKKILLLTALVSGLAVSAGAEQTVTLSDVHICCHSCVNSINKTLGGIDGLTTTVSQEDGTVVLKAADTATLQKGTDTLIGAGFFAKSSDPSVKINAPTGAKDQTVQTVTVEGLHLCCGKCVKILNEILVTVPGVTTNTAAKGVDSFTVTGNFNDKALFDALQKGGLTAHEK